MEDIKPQYIRCSQVQRVFGIHRSTLYRMAQRGEINLHKMGSIALVRVADLEALIKPKGDEDAA